MTPLQENLEIEAKFTIADHSLFQKFLALDDVAGATVQNRRTMHVVDDYYDTADGAFLRAGYACRVRSKGGVWLVALKSISSAQGPMHRRVELEMRIEPGTGARIAAWPAGPAADLANEICQGQPLERLVTIDQQRHVSDLADLVDGSALAELSLDQVWFGGREKAPALVMEIELRNQSCEDWLLQAVNTLGSWPGVQADTRSKLQRAIEVVRPDLLG